MKKDGGVGRFGKDYKVLGKNLDRKSFLFKRKPVFVLLIKTMFRFSLGQILNWQRKWVQTYKQAAMHSNCLQLNLTISHILLLFNTDFI